MIESGPYFAQAGQRLRSKIGYADQTEVVTIKIQGLAEFIFSVLIADLIRKGSVDRKNLVRSLTRFSGQ